MKIVVLRSMVPVGMNGKAEERLRHRTGNVVVSAWVNVEEVGSTPSSLLFLTWTKESYEIWHVEFPLAVKLLSCSAISDITPPYGCDASYAADINTCCPGCST